ncbi:MAG: hypothetical protein JNK15_16415 [Planctomycetes bacterium]|nr:hypothetical protein [Planctomycetota bacterium]
MRRSTALSCLLTFAAVVPAQISAGATANAVTVRSGVVVAAPVAPGTDVWFGLARQATSGSGNAFANVGQVATSTAVAATWQLGCIATSAGSSPAAASATVRYDFVAAHAFVGRLVVAWAPATSGTGSAALAVDVGDDGVVDAVGSATIQVAFGPGPLSVRVSGACTADAGSIQGPFGSSWSWAGSAHGNLTLRLEATHATTVQEGAACGNGAPALLVVPTLADGIEVRGDCPPGVDVAFLAIGFAPAAAVLPLPPACSLLVTPELIDAQWPDAQRRVVWSFAVPSAVRPLTLRTQLLGLDVAAFMLAASAAARTDLP